MSESEQRPEEIRARFEKIADEMSCMLECWPESMRVAREKCVCPGCKFRRMVARLWNEPDGKQNELEVYPQPSEIEGAFSELMVTIQRARKYEKIGDSALPMLEQQLLSSLFELKAYAEHVENSYQSMNTNRSVMAGTGLIAEPAAAPEIKVGSRLQMGMGMIGKIEELDGETMLVRFETAGWGKVQSRK